MVKYEGLFFNKKDILKYEKKHLPIINDKIHCTFKFKPKNDEIFNELVNKSFNIKLISYGYNKDNSGFEIELPKSLEKYYINTDKKGKFVKPHITASISKDGEAENTRRIKFIPLPKKITIKGKFGLWIKKDKKEFVSFKKQNKDSI